MAENASEAAIRSEYRTDNLIRYLMFGVPLIAIGCLVLGKGSDHAVSNSRPTRGSLIRWRVPPVRVWAQAPQGPLKPQVYQATWLAGSGAKDESLGIRLGHPAQHVERENGFGNLPFLKRGLPPSDLVNYFANGRN